MRCKYAKRSFFVLLSGHCSAISLVSLSSFVPASEIFLAALITSIVVFKGPRPLKKKNWTVVGHHTFVLTNLIDMEKTIKKKKHDYYIIAAPAAPKFISSVIAKIGDTITRTSAFVNYADQLGEHLFRNICLGSPISHFFSFLLSRTYTFGLTFCCSVCNYELIVIHFCFLCIYQYTSSFEIDT